MNRPQIPTNSVALRLLRTAEGTALPPVAEMRSVLDEAERARAARMQDTGTRSSFVAGRYAQRLLAAELLDVRVSDLASCFTCLSCGSEQGLPDHGRPGYSLNGEPVPLALSLSRAGGFVLLAALDTRGADPVPGACGVGVGVDLESMTGTAFDGFDDVALTRAERDDVGRLPEVQRAAARTRLWARKEALLKAFGTGFADRDPSQVDVLRDGRIQDLQGVDGIALEQEGLVAALAVAPL
ncbi:4'-phosphopantetheinyl transferase superfamily protein [Arthrobacter sp. NamB2]|uniref:4'-phosphopantetheinyl transferase family protein n=1 Tax=Arthrobacter sp. NamB2 TaxID=2576035 RepID=UPI0010C93E53|nr:4'-phosphopantetheinyl transferase superfamily protein [Arthrobacter sp. NamB2]TKV29436.1 4'-phosphopantetheinyl transferase superfamily protein [Arthrobacter sp. NamB2]